LQEQNQLFVNYYEQEYQSQESILQRPGQSASWCHRQIEDCPYKSSHRSPSLPPSGRAELDHDLWSGQL